MSDMCCHGFQSNCETTRIDANPGFGALSGCQARKAYFTVAGEAYPCMMPVKLGAAPGEVIPAPDGVDMIGFVAGAADGAAPQRVVIQLSAKLTACWSDIAPVMGLDATDPAAWWPIHAEALKTQIFVEFA